MNPSRGRFIRGRARGGGAYRPYFYFRRNGRTIPAGGARGETTVNARGGGVNAPAEPRAQRGYRGVARGGRGNQRTGAGIRVQTQDGITSSFLNPGLYAQPENALEVSAVSTAGPMLYPGWRLYFPQVDYNETLQAVKYIKALETHFKSHPAHYDLSKVLKQWCFTVVPKTLIDDNTLTQAYPCIMTDLQLYPKTALAVFGLAMHSVVTQFVIDNSFKVPESTDKTNLMDMQRVHKIYVRPVGFLDVQLISMISNENVDNLYCLRGHITALGAPQFRYSWVAYKCKRCGHEQTLKQQGFHPKRPNSCKNSMCKAKDAFMMLQSSPFTQISHVQIVRLTESHLQAFNMFAETPGQMDIELNQDLVNSVYPGEDVVITGILKMRTLQDDQEQQYTNSFFAAKTETCQIYMKAISIASAQDSIKTFSERDLEAISAINAEPDRFKLLVRSLVPEVYGYEMVKAAVLLSLFGGAGSQVHDESEINVLLVGDPGVGKSALLHAVKRLSAQGAMTRGKPITSAEQQLNVTTQGNSNIALHAGALASALNGHCCIDDIDQLASQQDQLVQVLETQISTLSLSNTFASLASSASIVAAANAMHGHYDHSRLLTDNIRINPLLLPQFPLVFLMLDKPSKDLDTSLTEHIKDVQAGTKKSALIAARFRQKPKNTQTTTKPAQIDEDFEEAYYNLEKRLKLSGMVPEDQHELELLPPELIKKFIAYARLQMKPLLTHEAAEEIKKFYMELRSHETDERPATVSTSFLHNLIRLTQARARVELFNEVDKLHVRDVICIVRQSISDVSIGDYVDSNPATNSGTKSRTVKKFMQTLQMRSDAIGRKMFDFDELKDMARRAGISCGVTNLVDVLNLQGFLLKKGPNMYELVEEY